MAEINYKVLIADDEYWTREKIRNMLDWKAYHLEFLEPAANGEEVLERMKTEKPDILITDINMPFVNGVELVKEVKEKYEEVVVFVISGYDDFEYVKSTLMAGAINYLLKPITKIDLVNALSKALEIISKEEINKKQILKAASAIQDRELSLLVEREETPFAPLITMNKEIDFAGYSLILIKIHDLKEIMAAYEYDMNYLSYSIKKMSKEVTESENLLIFNHIYRSNEFLIITELDSAEQNKMAVKLLNAIRNMTASPISIVISEHTYSIESIHTAYTQCVSLLMTRKYKKESIILFNRKQDEVIYRDLKDPLGEEAENRLKNLLKTGNAEAVKQLIFETIGVKHCEELGWEYIRLRQTVKRVCNLLTDFKMEQKSAKEIVDLENMVDVLDKTVEYMEADKLCEVIEEIVDTVVSEPKGELGSSIREVVKKAVVYINEQFFEELSLAFLSNHFGVESSYFSKVFRQETGESLMIYIAGKRIEKAKEYMLDSTINLTEIAFMVGYDDYTYFNKVFRKMTGMSPRDYRGSLHKDEAVL